MALLKGASESAIAENVRSLVSKGRSEADAIKEAHRHSQMSSEEDSVIDYTDSDEVGRRFVVVTRDFSGLGIAKMLADEGEDVTLATECPETDADAKRQYKKVAEGWMPVVTLKEAQSTLMSPSTYWLFTENNFPKVADELREKGQKVFGTSAIQDRLEHDRNYAVECAEECGLKSPLTEEFHGREKGLDFLDAHSTQAFVFKPDKGQGFETFVPMSQDDDDANDEVFIYLKHLRTDPKSYILQERVRGTEINVEVDFFEGRPFLAWATLEAKRKNSGEVGEMSGCAGDFVWMVPLDSPLVKKTVGRMFPYYEEMDYTGPADVNVILTQKGPMFLEVCDRMGYNAYPTLLLGMLNEKVGDFFADWMDGRVEDMPSRFKSGVAGSLTLFIDHPCEGLPIRIDPQSARQWYPFDGYRDEWEDLLTGYSQEVGCFVDHGPSIQAVADSLLRQIRDEEAVSFSNMYYRTDLASADFPNAPAKRYQELRRMGLV